MEIDEDNTRVASDIVSCGPAFCYLLQKFIRASVKETGIDEGLATELASEMLIGMGALIEKNYYTLPALQEKVSVKGGITGEGINVLENHPIEEIFQNLFRATHKKFQEEVHEINKQYNQFKAQ